MHSVERTVSVDFSCYLFITLSSLHICRNTRDARCFSFSPARCVFFLISMNNLISDRMNDGQYRHNNAPTRVTRRQEKIVESLKKNKKRERERERTARKLIMIKQQRSNAIINYDGASQSRSIYRSRRFVRNYHIFISLDETFRHGGCSRAHSVKLIKASCPR